MVNALDRFWSKVDRTGDCWLWTDHLMPKGYAQFHVGGSYQARQRPYAHRWIYEQTVGPIPEGYEIDHLCRVRHCVNPAHLEPVTHAENTARTTGFKKGYYNVGTHCPNGHERTPENTRLNTYGYRICAPCHRDGVARARRKRKQRPS